MAKRYTIPADRPLVSGQNIATINGKSIIGKNVDDINTIDDGLVLMSYQNGYYIDSGDLNDEQKELLRQVLFDHKRLIMETRLVTDKDHSFGNGLIPCAISNPDDTSGASRSLIFNYFSMYNNKLTAYYLIYFSGNNRFERLKELSFYSDDYIDENFYTKDTIDNKMITKQDKLDTTQLEAVNSGITEDKVEKYDADSTFIDSHLPIEDNNLSVKNVNGDIVFENSTGSITLTEIINKLATINLE